MNHTFGKTYKLKSKKQIGLLHQKGKSIFSFPFALRYEVKKEIADSPLQIMISAPKRSYKRAHDRNRIKRLIKEGLRMNKEVIESNILPGTTLFLSLTYRHNEILDFKSIDNRTKVALNKLLNAIEKEYEQD